MWHISVITIGREIITKWFSVHLLPVDNGRSGIRIREWDRNRVEILNMKIDVVIGIKLEKDIKAKIELELEVQTDEEMKGRDGDKGGDEDKGVEVEGGIGWDGANV